MWKSYGQGERKGPEQGARIAVFTPGPRPRATGRGEAGSRARNWRRTDRAGRREGRGPAPHRSRPRTPSPAAPQATKYSPRPPDSPTHPAPIAGTVRPRKLSARAPRPERRGRGTKRKPAPVCARGWGGALRPERQGSGAAPPLGGAPSSASLHSALSPVSPTLGSPGPVSPSFSSSFLLPSRALLSFLLAL